MSWFVIYLAAGSLVVMPVIDRGLIERARQSFPSTLDHRPYLFNIGIFLALGIVILLWFPIVFFFAL